MPALTHADWMTHARLLDLAMLEHREVERLTATVPALSLSDAYRIQDQVVALRLQRGERIVGYKMGLTSRAKMKQMGVESPIYGVLTDRMKLESGADFSLSGSIHAKIEPEIAFITDRELRGRVSTEEALAACSGVGVGMEIIDSRFLNFNFNLPDVIADNCSGSAFVLGTTLRKPGEVDLGNLGMVLELNGNAVQFGSSSAIYGHPGASLAELCAMLDQRGQSLPAGSIVLAGAATQAIALEPGSEIRTRVQDLGDAVLTISR